MPPQINTITPNFGVAGDVVVIGGLGFGIAQGASDVRFENGGAGAVAAINAWGANQVTCVVPNGQTGRVKVTVGGVESTSGADPANADFFHYKALTYPVAKPTLVAQNTKKDVSPPDLTAANAADFNAHIELLKALVDKVGIDNDPSVASLDSRTSRVLQQIIPIDFAVPVPGGGMAFPTAGLVGLHSVLLFPDGADTELMVAFTVPRRARVAAGLVLAVKPVFILSQAGAPNQDVRLDGYGEINTTALASAPVTVDVSAMAQDVFIVGSAVRSIPIDGVANPRAAPRNRVAFRFSRIGTDGADDYPGALKLNHFQVDYEV